MSKESNQEAGIDIELWNKVIEKNKNEEPCCDENNECCCNTFSPYMASPEDAERLNEQSRKEGWKRYGEWKRKVYNAFFKK